MSYPRPLRLNEVIDSKNNNFNLIRMIAATAVIFSHSFALALGENGFEPIYNLLGMSLGGIAVNVFFITSGLLVTRSLCFKINLRQFVIARALRIYPALIVSVLVCLIVGTIISTLSFNEFIRNNNSIKFILYNSSIIISDFQTLPGVFEQAPYDSSVNGSLWTLPWELRMYLVLLGVGVLILIAKRFKFKKNIIPITILLIALISTMFYFHYHLNQEVHWFYSKFSRFLSAFFLGGSLYILKNHIVLSKKILLGCNLLLIISFLFNKDVFFVVFVLFSPYIILCIAYLPKGKILQYNTLGDYSYGTYIYAWPIQQMLAITFIGITPAKMMFFTFFLTLFFAILSWHLIEKPAMRLKPLN